MKGCCHWQVHAWITKGYLCIKFRLKKLNIPQKQMMKVNKYNYVEHINYL